MNIDESADSELVDGEGVLAARTRGERIESILALGVVLALLLVAVLTWSALAGTDTTWPSSPSISISSL